MADNQLAPQVDVQSASPDYFQTIGLPLLRGRLITEADHETALSVAIINQTMAHHRWENNDPIGKRVSFNNGTNWITIVGIVGDAKIYGLNREVGDELYLPVKQNPNPGYLLVRTQSDPMSMYKIVRASINQVSADTAVDQVRSLEDARTDAVASPRLTAILLGLFAILALIITSAGIAGVIALSVTQRTPELGIRMALGASQIRVLGMVVRQGMAMVLIGLGIGVIGALILSRVMATFLFAVPPTDPITFTAVSSILLLVAVGACLMPARRVTRIDPMIALRSD
jgi:predicted permease